ncbi:hypothetical protein C8F01DRAFT_1138084 [Mycena amicta]|nr:hypothetical protein C8F01DRAFT_1138084 [Mycena amicta]
MSTSTDSVPEELWLEVLKYLTPADLRSLFATTTTFNRLARPFVFARFVFLPFWFGPEADPSVVEAVHKAGMERLACWLSEPAASLVRSGSVSQAEPDFVNDEEGHGDPVRLESTAHASVDILFNHVIENLGRLSGLKSLHMRLTTLSSTAITQIHRLAVLEELNIRFKSIPDLDENDFSGSHPLALTKLSIHESHTPEAPPRFGLFWLSYMHPLQLHTLSINSSSMWWAQSPDEVPIFAHVRTLTLFWGDDVLHPNFTSNLKKFPAVSDFGLQPRGQSMVFDDSIPDALRHAILEGLQSVLPTIKRLRSTVTDELPSLLMPLTSALAHLEMCPNFFFPPEAIMNKLVESRTVKCVALCLSDDDIVSFVQTGRFFPNVEQLRVTVSCWVDDHHPLRHGIESDLWLAISSTSPLPTTLKVLVVEICIWKNPSTVPSRSTAPLNPTLEQVARLRDAMIARFTALERFGLRGNGFAVVWRKNGDQRIILEAAELRDGEEYFDEVWETRDN